MINCLVHFLKKYQLLLKSSNYCNHKKDGFLIIIFLKYYCRRPHTLLALKAMVIFVHPYIVIKLR